MARAPRRKAPRPRREADPTGIEAIDRLAALAACTMPDYIRAVSTYVREQSTLAAGPKKAAQIRLSNALGRVLVEDLRPKLPNLGDAIVGERKVAGALRTTNADVSETHDLDGLRLAVELKPVNLAVGRAIWNRFGDLRTFAVNIHLKFPFAVVGGVLVIPTYEETGTKAAAEAAESEAEAAEITDETEAQPVPGEEAAAPLELEARPGLDRGRSQPAISSRAPSPGSSARAAARPRRTPRIFWKGSP